CVSVGRFKLKRTIRATVNYQISIFEGDAQHGLSFVTGVQADERAQVGRCRWFDALPDVFTVHGIGEKHFVVAEAWSAFDGTTIKGERTAGVRDLDRGMVADITVETGLGIFRRG